MTSVNNDHVIFFFYRYLQRFITAGERFRPGVREEGKRTEQLEDKESLDPPLFAPPPKDLH